MTRRCFARTVDTTTCPTIQNKALITASREPFFTARKWDNDLCQKRLFRLHDIESREASDSWAAFVLGAGIWDAPFLFESNRSLPELLQIEFCFRFLDGFENLFRSLGHFQGKGLRICGRIPGNRKNAQRVIPESLLSISG